jgi:hypothetical protein
MEPRDPTAGEVFGRTSRKPAFRPKEALAMLSALNGAYWSSRFPEMMPNAPPESSSATTRDNDDNVARQFPGVGEGESHA